jgi:2-polyprenyl-6-hydroxyphenyl methylase / 3-demethylubiquinone-9 3-methyltransferase
MGGRMKPGHGTTIDAIEVARFDDAQEQWWHPTGSDNPARWLHRYNPLRVGYIRDAACEQFQRDPREPDCLRGVRILDIGCGAGVLCEPLAALGATVVGVDPAGNSIEMARHHARQSGLEVDYRCRTSEELAADGERFDVVLAMEVIEHVADSDAFLRCCSELVKPGGLLILSTISRTLKSFAFAIVMGEYVLGLLPRGTHQWSRFRTPDEIRVAVKRDGLVVTNPRGVTMKVLSRALTFCTSTDVAYILTAKKPAAPQAATRAG